MRSRGACTHARTHAPQALKRRLHVCSLQQRPRQCWQQGGQGCAVCNLLDALKVVLQVCLRVLQQGRGEEGRAGWGASHTLISECIMGLWQRPEAQCMLTPYRAAATTGVSPADWCLRPPEGRSAPRQPHLCLRCGGRRSPRPGPRRGHPLHTTTCRQHMPPLHPLHLPQLWPGCGACPCRQGLPGEAACQKGAGSSKETAGAGGWPCADTARRRPPAAHPPSPALHHRVPGCPGLADTGNSLRRMADCRFSEHTGPSRPMLFN
jgi:hypothetical protein